MNIPLVDDIMTTFNINIDDLNIDKRMIEIYNNKTFNLTEKEISDYSKFPAEITMSSAQLNLLILHVLILLNIYIFHI